MEGIGERGGFERRGERGKGLGDEKGQERRRDEREEDREVRKAGREK